MTVNPPTASRRASPVRQIDSLALGASLYVPAIRTDLGDLLSRRKWSELRSIIICLEDSIHDHEIPRALYNLQRALDSPLPAGLFRFIRPRNVGMLKQLLRFGHIAAVDGFVLPKINASTLLACADAASRYPALQLMPTIETEIAFDRALLADLCASLEELDNPVLCIRTGANDLLRLLGLHRPRQATLYETPLRSVLEDLIKIFKPAGFEMAAPVFGHIDDHILLAREVDIDITYGLLTKGAVSPSQVAVIERAYRVSRQDYESAVALLEPGAPAVFKAHGQMLEVAVHQPWARRVLLQANSFGIKADEEEQG